MAYFSPCGSEGGLVDNKGLLIPGRDVVLWAPGASKPKIASIEGLSFQIVAGCELQESTSAKVSRTVNAIHNARSVFAGQYWRTRVGDGGTN